MPVENKYGKKILPGIAVVAICILSLITFFSVRAQTALPEDAYSVVQENSGGGLPTYVVNEKYSILAPTDSELFTKPYCQTLAESRIVTLEDKNKIDKSHELLLEVARISETSGDLRLSEAIKLFVPLRAISANEGEGALSEEEELTIAKSYDIIVDYAKEMCAIAYSPEANPRVLKEIQEEIENRQKNMDNATLSEKYDYSQGLQTEGEQWEKLTQDEKLKILKEAKALGTAIAPYSGVELAVTPNLFTEGYCANFIPMSEGLALGGTYEELDAVVVENLQKIVELLQTSQPGSEKLSAYERYLNVYATVGRHFYISHSGIYAQGPEYTDPYMESLGKANEFSQKDCGVNLLALKIP